MSRGLQIMVEMEKVAAVQEEAVREGDLELYLGAVHREAGLFAELALLYKEALENGSVN